MKIYFNAIIIASALKANALMNQSPLTFSNEGQHSIEPKGAASLDTLDNLAVSMVYKLNRTPSISQQITCSIHPSLKYL